MRPKEIFFIKTANTITAQRLCARYLVPHECPETLDGATIEARRVGNRTGLPEQGAETWRYHVEGDGWAMTIRAAWYAGALVQPLATYCVVEQYTPETPDSMRSANLWLRSLAL